MKRLLVDDLHLLADTLLMDELKDMCGALWVDAAQAGLCSALLKDLVVTAGLEHSHIVLLLVLTYFAANAHTFRDKFHELIVKIINLAT